MPLHLVKYSSQMARSDTQSVSEIAEKQAGKNKIRVKDRITENPFIKSLKTELNSAAQSDKRG